VKRGIPVGAAAATSGRRPSRVAALDQPRDNTLPDESAHESVPALPSTAQDNLELVAEMAEREDAKVDRLRALIERVSTFFGSPRYFVFALTFIVVWIAINLWGRWRGWTYVDEPPFFWLQGIVSSNALLLTISVLIRQDRMARLAEHRAHLDLQINMLTERKVTKALELVAAMSSVRGPAVESSDEFRELLSPADVEAIMGVIKRGDSKPT
jgi:uncharacterized membrane protein